MHRSFPLFVLALTAWAPAAETRTGPNPDGRLIFEPGRPGAVVAGSAAARPAGADAAQVVNVPLAAGAVQIDSTYYDIQDMGSMGAHIVVGADGRIHVTWQDDFCENDVNGCPPNLNLPQPHPLRGMGYAYRDAQGTWHHLGKAEDPSIRSCFCVTELFGGFGSILLTNDGRAAIAQHMNEDGCDLRGDLYIQNTLNQPGWKAYLTPITDPSYLFPTAAATPGGSFVVLGEIPKAGDYSEVERFAVSRIAAEGPTFVCPTGWQGGAWTQIASPTLFLGGTPAFPQIAAASDGRVGVAVGDFGGNVFLIESSNGTFDAGTITTRNLTNYSQGTITASDSTSTEYRPYVHCAIAYNDTTPHVVWSELQARREGGQVFYYDHRSRIRHWSSVDGVSTVRQVQPGEADTYDDVDQGLAGPLCGFNTISVDWPQVGFSEDGTETYVVWLRYVDSEVDPTGNMGLPGIVTGIGFGDIMASVRRAGEPWSPAQNLTNTPQTDERFVSLAVRNPGGKAHLLYQSSATNQAGVAAIGDRGGTPGNMLRRIAYLAVPLAASNVSVEAPAPIFASPLVASPNPARGAVRFSGAPRAGGVVEVFSPAGRRIARLPVASGGTVTWDGRDAGGARVPAGLYFARLAGGEAGAGTRFLLLQ
jgi:hypothetical protein